ncbi:MAG: hypothetical protein U0932_07970 [Thiobacillus sp.]|nr:hypothetical protein [Thiobacillus sp.]
MARRYVGRDEHPAQNPAVRIIGGYRPNAAGRSFSGSKAGIQAEQSLGGTIHGQQVSPFGHSHFSKKPLTD